MPCQLIVNRKAAERGERELANKLKEYGFACRRGQQFSGASGDADVIGLDKIHIECKRAERLNLSKAMSQSIRDCNNGNIPVVMHRKNREDWLVTMQLSDWIELYKEWIK